MPTDTKPRRGRIARKILDELAKAKSARVVDLDAVRRGEAQAEAAVRACPAPGADSHPTHQAYVSAMNLASLLLEQLQDFAPLRKHVERIADADEEYMPSGPPMSPLTRSFFSSWALFDLALGADRETFGSVAVAIASAAGAGPVIVEALEHLCASSTSLYCVDTPGANDFLLDDFGSGEQLRCICPAGYDGAQGELWFARVVPPLLGVPGPHVVLTTPYLIIDPPLRAWADYLQRTVKDSLVEYRRLMKRGPHANGWCEYVFEAYVNHEPEVIYLRGLPDVAESRPWSEVNAFRE